jgi:hypothetical protein
MLDVYTSGRHNYYLSENYITNIKETGVLNNSELLSFLIPLHSVVISARIDTGEVSSLYSTCNYYIVSDTTSLLALELFVTTITIVSISNITTAHPWEVSCGALIKKQFYILLRIVLFTSFFKIVII